MSERKDPSTPSIFGINWLSRVGDDAIIASEWTVPAGITEDSNSFTTTTTAIMLSGGTAGTDYRLVNHVTLTSGQEEEDYIDIEVREVEADTAYCSTREVRAVAAQMSDGVKSADSPTAIEETDLRDLIERASRIFDQACGATPGYFQTASSTATERTFYGDGTGYLKIDPYIAGSLDVDITLPTGYTVPTFIERGGCLIQAVDVGGNGLSSDAVASFSNRGSWCQRWAAGVPVTISARWGWPATPGDVKAAVIELVINMWRETDPATLRLVSMDGGALRESLPPRVRLAAKRYQINVAEVVFA